ncbi:MAG: cohesin domain-containing protein [bacterium]|nr:cohesin domain-containing protein [bacterium]
MKKQRRQFYFFNKVMTAGFCLLVFLALAKAASAAGLSLTPSSGNVKSGEELKVQLVLDTDSTETVDGADAILTFDDNRLKPKEVKSTGEFSNLITKESPGRLQITALASKEGQNFETSIPLAEVTFTILQSGVAAVGFDFSEGSTTDSNVVQHKTLKDILQSVNGGNYSVTATPGQQTVSLLKRIFPILIIIFVLFLIGFGVFWFVRRGGFGFFGGGGQDEDVFYPESVPMDEVPKDVEIPSGQPLTAQGQEEQTAASLPTETAAADSQPPVSVPPGPEETPEQQSSDQPYNAWTAAPPPTNQPPTPPVSGEGS